MRFFFLWLVLEVRFFWVIFGLGSCVLMKLYLLMIWLFLKFNWLWLEWGIDKLGWNFVVVVKLWFWMSVWLILMVLRNDVLCDFCIDFCRKVSLSILFRLFKMNWKLMNVIIKLWNVFWYEMRLFVFCLFKICWVMSIGFLNNFLVESLCGEYDLLNKLLSCWLFCRICNLNLYVLMRIWF